MYRNYSGADKVLLAELALQGRFHEIGEELFAKRVHQGCTHYKTTRERAQHEGEGGIPQLRMLRDYTKMTFAADIGVRAAPALHGDHRRMARRGEVWRRLLVPGPDNYLGCHSPASDRPDDRAPPRFVNPVRSNGSECLRLELVRRA